MPLKDDARMLEGYSFKFVKNFSHLIGVKGGGETSAPAVTRRKDIGRMTVRPISFQRDQRVR